MIIINHEMIYALSGGIPSNLYPGRASRPPATLAFNILRGQSNDNRTHGFLHTPNVLA
jgi:hypothetical protein